MDFSNSGFRALGGVELAASIGLLLPIFIGSVELLTPLAATALVVLQTWKGTLHWRRTRNGAYATLTLLIVLGLLVILWDDLGHTPFELEPRAVISVERPHSVFGIQWVDRYLITETDAATTRIISV